MTKKTGRRPTHGLTGTPEYRTWIYTRARCRPGHDLYDPAIGMHEAWKESPAGLLKFLSHVGKRPNAEHVLDRIDLSRGYEPGNVQWVLKTEQLNHRKGSRLIDVDGQVLSVAQWSRLTGLSDTLITRRMEQGWTPARAVTVPASRTGVRLPISPCLHGHGPCQCPCGFEKPTSTKKK